MLLIAGLGFGLALPYLAIAFVPVLRRAMPRPGPWLERFRNIMGVPMALTALALLWLLWRLSGMTGLLLGLGAGFILLGLLTLLGRAQVRGGANRVGLMLAGLALAIGATLLLPREPVAANKAAENQLVKSEPFSEAKLSGYRADGVRVFAYFTADWCVTCKVNEATAIQRDDTARAFAAKGIKVLEGDFTRRDPAIARFLAQHGRSGVPLYLYYPKGGEAQILPQVLTSNMLQELP